MRFFPLLVLPLALASCGGAVSAPDIEVSTWGTMHEVLREGQSEGRVALTPLANTDGVGVGAMADLAGEVTILNGRVLVASVPEDGSEGFDPSAPRLRDAAAGDTATLLVFAEVPAWEEVRIDDCSSLIKLEGAIADQLRQRGMKTSNPQPIRIRGRARHLAVHVIAGACPIANPSGPPPWSFAGPVEEVELVGFYAEEAAGTLTHHNRHSHLHAVADSLMGHLDEVSIESAVLLLPVDRDVPLAS